MDVASILSFSSQITHEDEKTITKCYRNISDSHWKRILNNHSLLEEKELGPIIVKVTEPNESGGGRKCITMEKIIPFKSLKTNELYLPKEFNKDEIKEKINEAVTELHKLDRAHGDLNLANIGFIRKNGQVVVKFIDLDTMFTISSKFKKQKWVGDLMKKGFALAKADFEEFVEHDHHNYEIDLEEKDVKINKL